MTSHHDSTGIDALVRAIEALQERIRNDGDTIGSNEIRTRTALVDPLLTALGWDTTDPAMVIPEYAAGGGTADYALLKVTPDGGSPVIAFIEAKRLHEPLEPHRAQMLTYANMSGVKYAGLTNGDRWELYEVFKEAPLHERRLVDVSLRRESAFDCAIQLLPLRWPSLETEKPPSPKEAQSFLRKALKANATPSAIRLLLNRKADIEGKDADRLTPLHYAIREGSNPALVEFLLDNGASITTQDIHGWTPLHFAALRGDYEVVKILLDYGADINAIGHRWETPLHIAASSNSDPGAAALLLDWGADIEATADQKWTPLHFASASISFVPPSWDSIDKQCTVTLLLDKGANIAARTNLGQTPLHLAFLLSTSMGHINVLLDNGADSNAADYTGRTPLHEAFTEWVNWTFRGEEGDWPCEEAVELLINQGADVAGRDIEGRDCLYLLVEQFLSELLERAEMHQATHSINFDDQHILYDLVEERWFYNIAYFLLIRGADIHAHANNGDTAAGLLAKNLDRILETAREYWSESTGGSWRFEGELGASVNLLQHGLLFSQRFWFSNPSVEQISAEISRGVAVTAADNYGMTPLHYAVQHYHNTRQIEYLLANGADIMARDNRGDTPLHSAMFPFDGSFRRDYIPDSDRWHWKAGTVNTLLAYGADATAKNNNGNTPLHLAIACGSGKIGRIFTPLLWPEHGVRPPGRWSVAVAPQSQGADLAAQNNQGETPLHFAVRKDLPNVFLEKFIHSSVVNIADENGETPLHWAARWARTHAINPDWEDVEQPSSIEVLLGNGADIEAQGHNGQTPLHAAAMGFNRRENVKSLLDRGADPAAITNEGKTPYQLAVEHDADKQILHLLRV